MSILAALQVTGEEKECQEGPSPGSTGADGEDGERQPGEIGVALRGKMEMTAEEV